MRKSGWRSVIAAVAVFGLIAGVGGLSLSRAASAPVEGQATGSPAGASLAQKMYAPFLANDEVHQVATSPTPTNTPRPSPTATRVPTQPTTPSGGGGGYQPPYSY